MEPGEPFYPRPPTRQSSAAPSSSSQLAGPSAPRRRQRRRCQLCGSRRFHRDGSTGLIVCDEGHVLQGYREEVGDEGDDAFKSSSQRRKKDRTGIEDRKQRHKRERQRRERKFWKGPRGRFLKYQCLQLLLRLQIQALREEVPSLPDQLEAVARELWALWVSRVPHLEPRPLVEQLSHAAEKLRMQQWSVEVGGSKIKAAAAAISASQREAEDRERQLLREQEDEQRERLDEALREAGVGIDEQGGGESSAGDTSQWDYPYSQDSGLESAFEDEDGEVIIPRYRKRRSRAKGADGSSKRGGEKKEDPDGMSTVTAILYLSLLTLRVPLLWNDLVKLIASGKMPYMHALHHLPPEMMSHLPYASVQMLDPKRVPSVMKLQSKTAYVAAKLNSAFGVEFPSVNALPMLLACTQRMLLPPTFYLAAKTLVGYANISMHAVPLECSQKVSVRRASSPGTSDSDESGEDEDDSIDEEMDQEAKKKAKAQQQGRLIVTVNGKGQARCAVLMAVLVVVAKMHYGLDDQERVERASTHPTGAPKLFNWLDALGSLEERLRKDTRLVFDPQGMDLFEMDEEHLDAYLDYLEDNQILLNNHGVYDWRRREGNIDDLLSCAPGAPPIKKLREDNTPNHFRPDLDSAQMQRAALSPLQAVHEHSQQALQRLYTGKTQMDEQHTARTSLNDLAPGQEHAIYSLGRNFDPSKLDGPLRQVVEAACSVVGISMEDMMMTISAIEKKLVKTLAKGKAARLASQASVPPQL